jgi:O-antigen/teichoic acid export membrane protein
VKFKLARDFLVLSSGQFVSKVVGFVAFAYLARTLGPESYGVVEYVVGLATFFAMVVDWGMGPIGVRELAAKPEKAASLAALISGARLVIACVAVPVLGLVAFWSGQPETAVKLVWLYALSLLAAPWNQDWLLQGREMMNAAAFAQLIRMCAFATGVVILVHSELDILYVGLAEIAAVVLTTAYYLGTQKLRVCPVRLKLTPRDVIRMIREGFPVGLSNVVWAFIQYAPLFLVANLAGGVSLAWFAASHRVVISLLTFSWIYHWNLYPAMARRAEGSPDELQALIGASFRIVAWGGILIALILTVVARPLMVLGFGDSFAEAAPAFTVLIWALPVTLLSGHARWALIAKGLQRYVLFAQLAGAAAVLLAGLALTSRYGAVGAAIAMTAASVVIWVVVHAFAVREVGPLPGITAVLLPAGGAGLAGLLAQGLNTHPLLGALAAAAAYVPFALIIDRKLLPDLLRLMRAKEDVEAKSHAAS